VGLGGASPLKEGKKQTTNGGIRKKESSDFQGGTVGKTRPNTYKRMLGGGRIINSDLTDE